MPREARLYEAPVALDGGADGVDVHRRVIAGARDWLAPGGACCRDQPAPGVPRTSPRAREHGLTARVERDEDRAATVLVATLARRAQPKRPWT